MATREYAFVVGPETSTLPTVGTPSASTDLVTLGYADENYMQGGSGVADITALKAVSAANRSDKDVRFVESTNTLYRFDSGSAASGDDNLVVTPSAGTGRWLILARNPMENSTVANDTATGANATLTAVSSNVVRLTNGSLTSIDMVPAPTVTSFFLLQNKTGVDISINNETGGTAANRILTGTAAAMTVTNNASVILLYDLTSSRWNVVGGSGGGSSGTPGNYFPSTVEFGNAVTGWTAYADAPATTAVDMTGGSPSGNLTFALSTSSPLSGSSNILLSKTAANLQGEGWAYAITPNISDRGKVVSLSFNYAVSSGTYASDDIFVCAYDVTNSVAVPLMPQSILNHTLTSERWFGELQIPYTCASLRIGFHVSSTSASAYALKIDNLVLSDSNYGKSYGNAVTDWVSYTPTYTGFGTVTGSNMWYRRVGDSIQIRGHYTVGTPTAVEAKVTFPTGVTVDSTKITALSSIGTWAKDDTNSSTHGGLIVATASDSYFGFGSANASYVFSGSAFASTILGTRANGDAVVASGKVTIPMIEFPVTGWNSSQLLSDQADTRVIAAAYHASANGTTSTTQTINFDTKLYDTLNCVTAAAAGTGVWKFTAPVAGVYQITGYAAITAAATEAIQIYKNGTIFNACSSRLVTAEGANPFAYSINLVAGDYIDVRLGGSRTYIGGTHASNSAHCWIEIKKLQGPAQIRASESPRSEYWYQSGNGYGSVNTVIRKYSNLLVGTGTAITASNSATAGLSYTINETGLYGITMTESLSAIGSIGVSVNSAQLTTDTSTITASTCILCYSQPAANYMVSLSATLKLTAGDVVRPHNGGTTGGTFNDRAGFRIVKLVN